MAYTGPALGDRGSETDINTANQWMRSQPWYLEFLKSQGQDPAAVRLSDSQRQRLGALMVQHGLPLPEKNEIDQAGNINPRGHKLRNFLIGAGIAGAAVTGGLAAPALFGGAGVGAGAGAGAGVGSFGSMLLGAAVPTGINAGASLIGQRMQNTANTRASDAQRDAANYAADLEHQSAQDVLAFQKEQEAQRQKEWAQTQQRNWELEQARLARAEPFRQAGVRSLGQLLMPIRQRQPRATGTLG